LTNILEKKVYPAQNEDGDCQNDLVSVVFFAGDSVVPCTPRRDIDVPDPAKMLIGRKFKHKRVDQVFYPFSF
jgi:hypothetical protein